MAFYSNFSNQIALTQPELLDICNHINRVFSPAYLGRTFSKRSSAAFSAQELLEISTEISRDFSPRAAKNPTLVLLPVAPHQLHVYWQFAANEPLLADEAAQSPVLMLKFFQEAQSEVQQAPVEIAHDLSSLATLSPGEDSGFMVAVDPKKNHQEIVLPANISATRLITAELGYQSPAQDFKVLLTSNPAQLPAAPPEPADFVKHSTVAPFIMASCFPAAVTSHMQSCLEKKKLDE